VEGALVTAAEDRADLAAAVNTIEGLNCTPYYRVLSKPGEACVRLAKWTPGDTGFGYVVRWRVYIALSQDLVTAEKWLDDNLPLIAQALEDVWVPGEITPAELIFDTAAINGVIYEGIL
jgi:hypothetical protein